MKLTPGILKSVESSFYQNYNNPVELYICKYKGKLMYLDKEMFFTSKIRATNFITTFVREIFWHGEYFHQYRSNIKNRTGYDVDYSETIKILSSHGLTSRFELPENKKMFKDIANNLIKEEIITIEQLTL